MPSNTPPGERLRHSSEVNRSIADVAFSLMQKSRTESTTEEKIMNKHTLIPIILLIIIFTSTTSIAQDPPIQLGKGGITDIAYIADGNCR